jgi:hypothetical protein
MSCCSKPARSRRHFIRLAIDIIEPLLKANLTSLKNSAQKRPNESDVKYYKRLRDEANDGPIFKKEIIDLVRNFDIEFMPMDKKTFVLWLASALKADPSLQFRMKDHNLWIDIRDFLNKNTCKEYSSVQELSQVAKQWRKDCAKDADNDIALHGDLIVRTFKNGYTIVRVKPDNLNQYANAMGLGGISDENSEAPQSTNTTTYSLKNSRSLPLAIIEVSNDDEIVRIKGNSNQIISEEYRPYILKWIDELTEGEFADCEKLADDYIAILSPEKTRDLLKANQSEQVIIQLLKKLNEFDLERSDKTVTTVYKKYKESTNIRTAIASNHNTETSVLEKLSKDEHAFIRYEVARNSATSSEILENLSNDEDYNVRYAVAANENTPVHVLEKLSKDNDKTVRYWASINPNSPSYTSEGFVADKDARNNSGKTILKSAGELNEPLIYLNKIILDSPKNDPKNGPLFNRKTIEIVNNFEKSLLPNNPNDFIIFLAKELQNNSELSFYFKDQKM